MPTLDTHRLGGLLAGRAQDARSIQQHVRLLAKISKRIAVLRSEGQMLSQVVELLVEGLPRAHSVDLVVVGHGSELSVLYGRDRGGESRHQVCGGIDALPPEHREQFHVPRVLSPELLSVPLLAGSSLLGLLVVEAAAGEMFEPAELDTLCAVASQLSVRVQHLRAAPPSTADRRLEVDLEAARRIQAGLLPALPARLQGFRVCVEYRPAYEVGGDFYEIVAPQPGRLLAVVGDVSGKGVSGALVMARAVTECRRLLSAGLAPNVLLHELNTSFVERGCDETFVTAVCLDIDLRKRRMVVANAGHVLPLVRRGGGPVMPVGGASGPPVGMLPGQAYRNEPIAFEPGDAVLLTTDGVLDALHADGDQLGMRSLLDIIGRAAQEPREMVRRVLQAVEARGPDAAVDDVTLLAIEAERAYNMGA